MDAQAILTKIEQDAKDAAQKVRNEADEKAKTIKLEAQANREMLEKTMLAQAEQECAQMEERMHRMADLDDRKAMLRQKRTVIDEAFALAKEKLEKTKPKDRRAFFLRKIAEYAGGEETLIVGADDADWFDDGFLADANKALKAAGKPGTLKLQKEREKGCAGVVLSHKGAQVCITFDSLLDEARAELEQAAAQALFSE
jgi:V/A-type H+-transporting ATPase subunit E